MSTMHVKFYTYFLKSYRIICFITDNMLIATVQLYKPRHKKDKDLIKQQKRKAKTSHYIANKLRLRNLIFQELNINDIFSITITFSIVIMLRPY